MGEEQIDAYSALSSLIGEDPEIQALQAQRDQIAQQRAAIADESIKGVDITPAQAFAQLLAAAPAAILGGAIGGKRGLGAGLTAGGQAVEGSMARLEKKNERQQKGLALKDAALQDQSKEISEQLQKRTEFGQNLVRDKAKEKLQEDKEYNIAERTKDIKKEIAAAGRSNNSVTVAAPLNSQVLDKISDVAGSVAVMDKTVQELQKFTGDSLLDFRLKSKFSGTEQGRIMDGITHIAVKAVGADQEGKISDRDVEQYKKILSGDFTANAKDVQDLISRFKDRLVVENEAKLRVLSRYDALPKGTPIFDALRQDVEKMSGSFIKDGILYKDGKPVNRIAPKDK